jgi:mannose/fructose-specific phosphotransferase system component IIA
MSATATHPQIANAFSMSLQSVVGEQNLLEIAQESSTLSLFAA